MEEGFRLMQRPDGESIYLRLTTRTLRQIERAGDGWKAGAIAGAYWLREPAAGAEAAIVYSGAIAPEAIAAWESLKEDVPGLGLLAVTSPDLLHRGWSARRSARWSGSGADVSHIEQLLAPLSRNAGLVTLLDGAPASLSWIGGVYGHRVSPLGVDRFGQTGTLNDLYREYRLDADAIVEAAAELFLD
jgi:pyruvate dehydrogenase E1 component